jgi:hypothetical protein
MRRLVAHLVQGELGELLLKAEGVLMPSSVIGWRF